MRWTPARRANFSNISDSDWWVYGLPLLLTGWFLWARFAFPQGACQQLGNAPAEHLSFTFPPLTRTVNAT